MPIAIYGTFSVEIHPNLFAFGVLTTLFSFSLLTVYGLLMTASVRRSQARNSGMQEDIE
jgi:putative spermidine/putrescine transport system permease protein